MTEEPMCKPPCIQERFRELTESEKKAKEFCDECHELEACERRMHFNSYLDRLLDGGGYVVPDLAECPKFRTVCNMANERPTQTKDVVLVRKGNLMACPKCGSEWVCNRRIIMVNGQRYRDFYPNCKPFYCGHCDLEFGEW